MDDEQLVSNTTNTTTTQETTETTTTTTTTDTPIDVPMTVTSQEETQERDTSPQNNNEQVLTNPSVSTEEPNLPGKSTSQLPEEDVAEKEPERPVEKEETTIQDEEKVVEDPVISEKESPIIETEEKTISTLSINAAEIITEEENPADTEKENDSQDQEMQVAYSSEEMTENNHTLAQETTNVIQEPEPNTTTDNNEETLLLTEQTQSLGLGEAKSEKNTETLTEQTELSEKPNEESAMSQESPKLVDSIIESQSMTEKTKASESSDTEAKTERDPNPIIENNDCSIVNLESASNNDAVADVIAAMEMATAAKGTESSTTLGSGSVKATVSRKKPSRPVQKSENTSFDELLPSSNSNQKRRKKDPSAPKAPLNGYLVYFNRERTEMHQKNPHIGFGELTKIIANKWKEMPTEEKQRFINEADVDKERYVKEMADYKKSDSYKQYLRESSQAKMPRVEEIEAVQSAYKANVQQNGGVVQLPQDSMPNLTWLQGETNIAGFDVPIFTEEFIEHSKSREQELRFLRKEINELEQQNSVLNKHIESLRQSTQKCEMDCDQYRNMNQQVQKNLDVFRQTVLHFLSSVPLPNSQDYPTQANIDEYIARLLNIVKSSNQSEQQGQGDQAYLMNRGFVQHVKTVFAKINFNSLFE